MTAPDRIGCAGWNIPRDAAHRFPGEGSHLQRYAAVFNAAEINSSFYKPHQASTYARWAAATPDAFRFAVKLPRSITHDAKLRDLAPLPRFAEEVAGLENKLGAILVQLPPSLALDPALAQQLFDALHARFDCTLACEARHPSWFADEGTALLRAAGVRRVMADPPVGYTGEFVPTTDAAYIRLHGHDRIYWSRYTPEQMADVRAYLDAHPGSWCILDNTASGAAVPNALELLDQAASPAVPPV